MGILRKGGGWNGLSGKYSLVSVRRAVDRSQLGGCWCALVHHDRWYPHWEAVLQVCEACIFPFGKEVEYGGSAVSVVCNIFWLIFSGIPMAVEAAVLGAVLCVTIIGIPFGKQCFKLAKLALMPFGATVR